MKQFNGVILLGAILCNPCFSSTIEIIEDYTNQPASKPIENAIVTEDYSTSNKEIALIPHEPSQKKGLLRETANMAALGLFKLCAFTTRTTAGTFATYYFSQTANIAFSTAAYNAAMYFNENILVGNIIYMCGISTCLPLTTAVVFYLGYRSPDIIYYSGKTIIKVVQIASKTAIPIAKGASYTVKSMMDFLANKKQRDELIELIAINQPTSTDVVLEGNK